MIAQRLVMEYNCECAWMNGSILHKHTDIYKQKKHEYTRPYLPHMSTYGARFHLLLYADSVAVAATNRIISIAPCLHSRLIFAGDLQI